jgi:peptidoglycan/xylan/chitin deacetylase (PgdA/CDA1 family)
MKTVFISTCQILGLDDVRSWLAPPFQEGKRSALSSHDHPPLVRDLSRRSLFTLGAAGLAGAALAACSGKSAPRAAGSPTPLVSPTASPTPPPDPAAIHANELGLVPVLMHHRVVDKVESEFDMTPAYFRAELQRLYAEGYYPVRTLDLVHGTFDHVPPGKTPVVMTFDDGSPGQFGYTSTGAVNPNSGVGILLDFHAQHPDFPAVASMYINRHPFQIGDTSKALGDLNKYGFEIGNHTFHHLDLKPLDSAKVQEEFGQLQQMVEHAVPGLRPRTMALPLGVEPKNHALARTGMYGGERYVNEGVLLVGANPSHSPYHRLFDAQAIPRIRSSSYQGGRGQYLATYWLDFLKAHPDQRYRAAGNPGKVTFPRKFADILSPKFRAVAVTY